MIFPLCDVKAELVPQPLEWLLALQSLRVSDKFRPSLINNINEQVIKEN